VNGTLGQINLSSNTITVMENNQNSYTISLTAGTRVVQSVPATSSDLKSGLTVTVMGQQGSDGSITASSVSIADPGALR
jgi:hypothetical protein